MGYSLAKRRAIEEPVPEPTPAMTANALADIVGIDCGLGSKGADVYYLVI